MFRNSIHIILLLFFITSCTSIEVEIVSEPTKADVYLKNGKQLKKVGQTPIVLSNKDLDGFESYQLSIQKEGYIAQDIYLQPKTLQSKAEIYATLEKKIGEGQVASGSGEQDLEISQRQIASIQSQIIQNNYQQAEILARSFLDKYPYSAVGWSLLGNSYLLQNRNQEALNAYSKALEFDPENKETLKMVQFLRTEPPRRDR